MNPISQRDAIGLLLFCAVTTVFGAAIVQIELNDPPSRWRQRVPPDELALVAPRAGVITAFLCVVSLFLPIVPIVRVVAVFLVFWLIGINVFITRGWRDDVRLVRALALLVASLTVALAAFIWSLR